jgi:molybdate transport system substrate-binding protein
MNRHQSAAVIATVTVALSLSACSSSKKAASPSTSPAASATSATTAASATSAASTTSAASATSTAAASSAAAASSVEASPSDIATAVSGLSGNVVVFAASSLKVTFTTLITDFEKANPGLKVTPSYGGSDTLAAQITQGAPVDVFAAASTATMGTVTTAGDAVGTPQVFAKNELEIAVAPNNPDHIATLADVTKSGVKLALCAATVPCGAAATKAFAAASLTPHPVTLEQDVTSVLTKLELGEVDAGIVYQTDVKSAGSKVSGVNFTEAASAINTYPIAVLKGAKNPTGAQAFVAFMLSPAGQQILQTAGFQQP